MTDDQSSAPESDADDTEPADDAGSHDEQRRGQDSPPWGSDEEFDPQRAWNLLQNTRQRLDKARADRDSYKAKVDEHAQAQLSDQEKLTADRDSYKSRAENAEGQLLRMQVAAEKGLTPAQAKRLQGATQEELEADADDLVASFRPVNPSLPPSNRPREQYRGGSDDPGEPPVETDPAKLAAAVRARGGNNYR